jgi:hypothetical protein
MKLTDLLKITKLNVEVPFIPYKFSNGEKDTLTIKKDGIYFSEETSIESFMNFDSKDHQYEISKLIAKSTYGNPSQRHIYYAVCSVLYNIASWNRVDNGEFITAHLNTYVSSLIKEIIGNLDFSQIDKMNSLIDIISEDKQYQQLVFNVTVYSFQKNRYGHNVALQKPQRFSFGNMKYHEGLKRVDITVYQDYVELFDNAAGRSFEKKIDRVDMEIESKIIYALDHWRCYYTN